MLALSILFSIIVFNEYSIYILKIIIILVILKPIEKGAPTQLRLRSLLNNFVIQWTVPPNHDLYSVVRLTPFLRFCVSVVYDMSIYWFL